jgi:hypothetical protein
MGGSPVTGTPETLGQPFAVVETETKFIVIAERTLHPNLIGLVPSGESYTFTGNSL